MTAFLIGSAIGFIVAVAWGYHRGRRIYMRQLETDIPGWVNQGNQTPLVISLADLEQEINFAIWETEMEDQ